MLNKHKTNILTENFYQWCCLQILFSKFRKKRNNIIFDVNCKRNDKKKIFSKL